MSKYKKEFSKRQINEISRNWIINKDSDVRPGLTNQYFLKTDKSYEENISKKNNFEVAYNYTYWLKIRRVTL